MDKSNSRLFWADLMRVIALVGVLIIHTSAVYVIGYSSMPHMWWAVGDLLDSVSRMAVPLFIMISGAFLLDRYKEGLKKFLYKRLTLRLVVPFLVWTLIYFVWRIYFTGIQTNEAIKLLLSGNIAYHLVFFNYFIGLYLLIPFLRIYTSAAKEADKQYLIVLWFVVAGVLPLIAKLSGSHKVLFLPELTGFAGYLILGDYLKNININRFKQISGVGAIFAVSIAVTGLGTLYLTKSKGSLDETFYEYLSPNVIAAAASGFILIRFLGERFVNKIHTRVKAVITELSTLSFGIYLVHVIWLEVLAKQIEINKYNPILAVPLSVVIIGLVSTLTVWLFKKVPYLNFIIP